jgi:serine/threonine-protein kinase RsbT
MHTMSEPFLKQTYHIIAGDYIKAGEASSNVKKALMQLGIKSDIVRRACIACYESEMNIVMHSLGGNIEVKFFENRIEIYAKDNGPGIENINLAMKERHSTASKEAREMGFGAGMGLPNIKKSSDLFEIYSLPDEYTLIKMVIFFY